LKNKGAITILSVVFLFSGFFLVRCARQGTPSGGPKDTAPPEVISEMPPNRSVFFNAGSASINFNEFVQLKDPSTEIFISPPMRIKPEFKIQGKKIIVEFQEELKANSTYTINFGNSIVDYTESNILINFEYVFSTGGHIDSLSIPGKVINAFNHEPEAQIIAMVYQDDNDTVPLDSLPFRVPPKSASKTTKNGTFSINNLSAGEYKLFALEDLNNNYIFDLPNERIAFLDSLITISPKELISVIVDSSLIDSTYVDSLTIDSITIDSTDTLGVSAPEFQILEIDSYTLFLFEEIDSTQKLLDKKNVGSSLIQYVFRMPADSVRIAPLGFQPGRPDWYIPEFSKMKDTVNFWLRYGLPDTIRVRVSEGDSLADTTRFILSRPTPERFGKRREVAAKGMKVSSSVTAGSLDLNKSLKLNFSVPVDDFDPGKLTLSSLTDTIIPTFSFSDTLQRQGEIEYKWLPGESYHFLIEDSAFCDLSGSYNDSISIDFKVRAMEDYGLLLMNIILPDTSGQYIIQMMTEKEIVVEQKIIKLPGLVRFEYLKPGNYKLKVIFDDNLNGKWDTGNYSKNSLPERVEYYTPALNIRANWDLQEEWQLEKK